MQPQIVVVIIFLPPEPPAGTPVAQKVPPSGKPPLKANVKISDVEWDEKLERVEELDPEYPLLGNVHFREKTMTT